MYIICMPEEKLFHCMSMKTENNLDLQLVQCSLNPLETTILNVFVWNMFHINEQLLVINIIINVIVSRIHKISSDQNVYCGESLQNFTRLSQYLSLNWNSRQMHQLPHIIRHVYIWNMVQSFCSQMQQ